MISPAVGEGQHYFYPNEPLLVPDWGKWKCQDTSSFHVHELKLATYKLIEHLDSLLMDGQMCHNANNRNYIGCVPVQRRPHGL